MVATEGLATFIKVNTIPMSGINDKIASVLGQPSGVNRLVADKMSAALDLPQITNTSFLGVFRWHDPLSNSNGVEYPQRLRSFVPVADLTEAEAELATAIITRDGPFIPQPRAHYVGARLNQLDEAKQNVSLREVPDHQGRGYRYNGIYYFDTPLGPQIKTTVCTKGSGTCGYWEDRRKVEMLDAIKRRATDYPLNPDPFHARDHRGQSTGQKAGDEVVWVGCASSTVTQREVEGFDHYTRAGIFSPICLPVDKFSQLPSATGVLIDVGRFTGGFDPSADLVVLGKAWANETRIWGNHFSHAKMSMAHLISSKEEGAWTYQRILDDLKVSAATRKQKLSHDEASIRVILGSLDPCQWGMALGHAGEILAQNYNNHTVLQVEGIIPAIMSSNMIENVARAGANRLWGKPVAWHLENVGRFGEVSGGERIYGSANGLPQSLEIHSLFAYMFDAYSAVAIEWASAGKKYCSIAKFYSLVKQRILELNTGHWLGNCRCLDEFVQYCQHNRPVYEVKFRSEDAFPLVAVPGTTDDSCVAGDWKNWAVLKNNLGAFLSGIRSAYSCRK